MRKGTREFVDERQVLEYDEVNSFYVILHIMQKHQYRHIYDSEISKINEHLTLLEEILQTSFPKVYHHLVDEMFINLVPIFLNIITTIFVADLQSKTPEIATYIFDVFLLDGESVIFTLLTQFITLKQDTILRLRYDDLLNYLRYKMPLECFKERSMAELLDLPYTIE